MKYTSDLPRFQLDSPDENEYNWNLMQSKMVYRISQPIKKETYDQQIFARCH